MPCTGVMFMERSSRLYDVTKAFTKRIDYDVIAYLSDFSLLLIIIIIIIILHIFSLPC